MVGIYFIVNSCLLINGFVQTFSACMFCFPHLDQEIFIDNYSALVCTWMEQNLKETLLLGNITCSETWKENIQGVFGFTGDKVVFC